MADEQVIRLLEEMRDLQKQHLENYKLALSNQQQALETQKQAVRRGRIMLLIVGAIVVALYMLPAFWWTMSWGLRCALRR
jgi:CHASE3 domain sensor protein